MSRSIEELEGITWPPSSVAQTGHALRRKKLLQLTTADLRLGLEQQIGVDMLAPLAAKRRVAIPPVDTPERGQSTSIIPAVPPFSPAGVDGRVTSGHAGKGHAQRPMA